MRKSSLRSIPAVTFVAAGMSLGYTVHMFSVRYVSYVQAFVIAGGSVFAWTTLTKQFDRFFDLYGTIFKVTNCIIPNPLATPCFYGACAFLVAFGWSLILIYRPSVIGQRWLRNFLAFGVVFASTVVTFESLQFYRVIGGPSISCSPGVSPLHTPCATGLLFFAAAFLISWALTQLNRR